MEIRNSDLEQLKLLIVDKNVHMRRLVRAVLHAFGVRNIQESVNGVEALEELIHFNAHVVITGWKMPALDGIELTDHLRSNDNSPNPFVPVIMMTSYANIDMVEKARDAGVDEIMAKPISAQVLYERLAAVITNPRLFVRSEAYFGPDRRRRKRGIESERREKDADFIARAPKSKPNYLSEKTEH